jgi:hypothetical protein
MEEMVGICRERLGYAFVGTSQLKWQCVVDRAMGRPCRRKENKSERRGRKDSLGLLLEWCVLSQRFPLFLQSFRE